MLQRTVFNRLLRINLSRYHATEASGSEGEAKITDLLRQRFSTAAEVQVQDVSGGCGSMYAVQVFY